ncbi:diguanylate cyclase [Erythrobacter sp. HKB08]|uniref:GGDEF domain-containing protein n=1 Tax=Erythrobacter sp. HKB08 TaxID=2502843 RepID=UPI0010091EA6|nr:sensor domain-containing diguanylate cyclase [Erythrobacter sp. HKB08]
MQSQIVGLVTPLMALVFVAVFLLLWWRGQMGNHVLGFAGSYAFFAIGFTVTHVFDVTSPYLFHSTQLFYTLGTVSVIWGAVTRVGQETPFGALALVYAISAATLAVSVGVSSDVAPRLYIVNTGYGIMFTLGAMALVRSRRRELFDTLVIIFFALSAINFFVRPVLTLLIEQNIPAADYRESIYYSVLNLALTIMSLVTAITLFGACVSDLLGSVKDRANRDGLTGLRNRQSFEHEVQLKMERARNANVPLALVVADIDHFKQVNDLWGHQTGDSAIAQFGRLIEGQIRDADISGRIGGEEFCILVWNCDEQAAERLATRIRKIFAIEQIDGMPKHMRLTASFGVAGLQPGERYPGWFARADEALYAAKEGGRDMVVAASDERVADLEDGDSVPAWVAAA